MTVLETGFSLRKAAGLLRSLCSLPAGKPTVGQEIITSLKEAIAWAAGEDVPVRVTTVQAPLIDVRAGRRRLGLSQSEFASKFGFQPATLKNWEQGRTRPDGPARVLPTVIARHPEAVEDALRRAG
jgi:putative transcriptional regulator